MTDRSSLSSRAEEYVRSFVGNLVGRPLKPGELDHDLGQTCFEALSRKEEVENPRRDRWGNWDWPFGAAHRRGELYVPWLDRQILARHPRLPATGSFWPEGKTFALCLTHDVDEIDPLAVFRIRLRRIQSAFRSGQGRREAISRALRTSAERLVGRGQQASSGRDFADWLRVEQGHDFRSTFFFFPDRPDRPHVWDCTYRHSDKTVFDRKTPTAAELMRQVDKAGWEVALHPSYHSALVSGLMVREKKQLETACGHEVISVRQHYLHYDVRVTPRLQADAGLKIDSSLGFNRSIGFRAGTSFPFCIWDHENDCPLPILEIPPIIMDCSLFETGSLEYNEGMALDHSLEIMDRVAEVGGCLTLNWHHDYIHDDRLWRLYGLLLEEAARRRAWGCSLRLLHDWWTAREKGLSVPLQ